MPRLRDQMTEALTTAAAAAREQGEASALHHNGAKPVAESEPAADSPDVPEAIVMLDRARPQPSSDLVQFGFRCPRDLKREVERFCFERELTLQDFGQAALRLMLDEFPRRAAANVQ